MRQFGWKLRKWKIKEKNDVLALLCFGPDLVMGEFFICLTKQSPRAGLGACNDLSWTKLEQELQQIDPKSQSILNIKCDAVNKKKECGRLT